MNPIKLSLCLALLAACATADTRSHAHGGFVGHAGPSLGAAHGHGGSFVSGHGASHGGSFGRGVGGHGGAVVVGHSVSSGPVYGGRHGGSFSGGHGGSFSGGLRPSIGHGVSSANIHASSFNGHGVHGGSFSRPHAVSRPHVVSRPHTSFSSGFSHGGAVVGHHGAPIRYGK
ncbi:keratin, type I cytoskeletal 9-like [Penaeus monodon]|uniref:keratin, type I cytoskeletal 9-like n=1 Tax=Penaeus monodon TaxID=6687 RepID=UPI0018A7CD37|nr:keratin, type I cytoskeletal 9-like [Penaeus monodon]